MNVSEDIFEDYYLTSSLRYILIAVRFYIKFTMISKLGKQYYMGIQDTGKVEVEKSLVAATQHQVKNLKHFIIYVHDTIVF